MAAWDRRRKTTPTNVRRPASSAATMIWSVRVVRPIRSSSPDADMGNHLQPRTSDLLGSPGAEQGREQIEGHRQEQQVIEPDDQREGLAQAAEDRSADVRAEVDVGPAAV